MVGRVAVVVASLVLCLAACTPASPAAPDANPVIIAGGTGAPAEFYEPLASRLRAGGYRVFIYTIPSPLSPFEDSAPSFEAFLERVLAVTGAAKADVVGHSQGVILVRYAAKFLGGGTKIGTLVSLSGGIYGSTLASSINESAGCLGLVLCQEASTGSDFLKQLNEPNDAIDGVHHVNITTIHDEIGTPYTNNLMYGHGDITNVVVQDQCPNDQVDHIFLAFDGAVASGIDDALARRPITLDCSAI
jgi:triacylglycerol esterase/lipase EstA (alpha/beta hydrolase family)